MCAQCTVQTECIYRGRRMNLDWLDWLVLTDINEYIQIINNNDTSNKDTDNSKISNKNKGDNIDTIQSNTTALQLFLKPFNRGKLSGLTLNSIPFGSNKFTLDRTPFSSSSSSSKEVFQLDYTWRSTKTVWERWK